MNLPVFINCRDRLTCLQKQMAWIERHGGLDPIIVDCDSTYPPLLAYYDTLKCPVMRVGNLGSAATWKSGAVFKFIGDAPYFAVTDCDVLPSDSCSLWHMVQGLEQNQDWRAVSFGIEIGDIPAHYTLRDDVLKLERDCWSEQLAPGWFKAPIDNYGMPVYRRGCGSLTI